MSATPELDPSALSQHVQRFVDEQVRPWSENSAYNAVLPSSLIDEMKRLGLFGMTVPTEHGGLELARGDLLKVIRILSEGRIALAAVLGSHLKVCSFLHDAGTTAQQSRFLPDLAFGKIVAAYAHTEETGKAPDSLSTTLVRRDAGWEISGEKNFVTHAEGADLFAVIAAMEGSRKLTVALLSKDVPGLRIGPDMARMGLHDVSLNPVTLDRSSVDSEFGILGGEQMDVSQLMARKRIDELGNYAARAVGLGAAALKATETYISAKISGNVVLAEIPRVQQKIAEMRRLQEESETLLHTMMDPARDVSLRDACNAKMTATENAEKIARIGLRLYGGNGYLLEHPMARYLQEAISLTIVGTPNDLLLDEIERHSVK